MKYLHCTNIGPNDFGLFILGTFFPSLFYCYHHFFLLTLFEEGFAFENGRESNGRHLLLLLTPRLRDGGTLAQRRVCFSSVIQHFSKVFQQKKIEMLQREQLFNRWKHS